MLGASLADVVDLLSFHQDPRGIEPSGDVVLREFVSSGARPCWTAVSAPAMLRFGMLGEYAALACPGLVSASSAPAIRGEAGGREGRIHDACDALDATLARAGASPSDRIAITSFHKDVRDLDMVGVVLRGRYGGHHPIWTPVGMTGFPDPDAPHCLHALAGPPRPSGTTAGN